MISLSYSYLIIMYHSSEISFIMHNFPCPSQTEHLEGSPTNYFSEFLFPLFSCFSICPPWRIMWPLLYCRSGQFLVWFISECGTAQLSLSLFFLFSCATADIVIDVDGLDNILPSWSSSTLTSMKMWHDRKTWLINIDILTLWRPMPSGQRP